MIRPLHESLIHIAADLMNGTQVCKALLLALEESGTIDHISSVYKRYLTAERVDLNAKLEFVIKYQTHLSVDLVSALLEKLQEKSKAELQAKRPLELTLLAFDSEVQLSPQLTLPYPEMHQDPLIVRCSAEAWGDYEHPIYQKNLKEIAAKAPQAKQAEFLCQGSALKS